jgi:hypothetical protein
VGAHVLPECHKLAFFVEERCRMQTARGVSELETYRNHRNELAHNFFIDYAHVYGTGDSEAYGSGLAFLQNIGFLFQEHGSEVIEVNGGMLMD